MKALVMFRHRSLMIRTFFCCLAATTGMDNLAGQDQTETTPRLFTVTLQSQSESSAGSGRFHVKTRDEQWLPQETAIVVCDMWDLHHCLNAVRRLEQFAPRLNAVLNEARSRGVTIIHSPSDCMAAYADHPARLRAIETPKAPWFPHDVGSWCSIIPTEERAAWPIDQSDGGEDDDPAEHALWAAQLKSLGRNPGTPWKTQSDLIAIDAKQDYISDRGDEVWNILESRGIRNVILTGVHLNMCVLGRPFGLRQMSRNGKNVVLMRDMTDTMYNPGRWPWINHFTATDRVISHVERYVCPTITSDQFVGGVPFHFKEDRRPHLVIVMAENEYHTSTTLPRFAADHLGRDFRVTTVFGSDNQRNSIPGFEVIDEADAVLISIRRRVLPVPDEKPLGDFGPTQEPVSGIDRLRKFVAAGKPVIGIRTASHAFAIRNSGPPAGYHDWPEFDVEVLGGNYHGHLGNDITSMIHVKPHLLHPILRNMSKAPFPQGHSLYEVSPLANGTTVLAIGKAEGHPEQPVAWTYQRADGGRSFYVSPGGPKDFANIHFQQLLLNGIHWAVGLQQPGRIAQHATAEIPHWSPVSVPLRNVASQNTVWLRCVVCVPSDWATSDATVETGPNEGIEGVFINGHSAQFNPASGVAVLPADAVEAGEANLLTLKMRPGATLSAAPVFRAGDHCISLSGSWQMQIGDDASLAGMPLPSKFGGSSDVVFMADEPLWVARPLTLPGEFSSGIEGPACDADGNIFAVNFGDGATIGRVTPDGSGEIFVTLPNGSTGNGIRFDRDGNLLVADYTQHNILRIDPTTKKITTFAHNPNMNQPNDIAIGPNGVLWASDPNWSNGTGQVWRIDEDGSTTLAAEDMGTTNGIEVSPDGNILYVNESVQRNIWAFRISDDGSLTHKRLLRKFEDHGFDGQRCDVDGNLYVTRHGKGTVVKLSPSGEILQEIHVLGARPSNLCFGGPDGRTVYVTEVESTRLVQFRVDRPGAAWSRFSSGVERNP
jgi:sugar lactone lactonase YvrE/nicotinamidase-related amidase/type 1 glutamine amidotransferase